MRILGPTRHERLNEAAGFVYLVGALVLALSLYSFHPDDPSWNTATHAARAQNLIGKAGAHAADLLFQTLGVGAWFLPAMLFIVGWKWLRSKPIQLPVVRTLGFVILLLGVCTSVTLTPSVDALPGSIPAGGMAGVLLADGMVNLLNPLGAAFLTGTCMLLSLYLMTSFSLARIPDWSAAPSRWARERREAWNQWREEYRLGRLAKEQLKEERRREKEARRLARQQAKQHSQAAPAPRAEEPYPAPDTREGEPYAVPPIRAAYEPAVAVADAPPWEEPLEREEAEPEPEPEIPICVLEEPPSAPPPAIAVTPEPGPEEEEPQFEDRPPRPRPATFALPSPCLLNEAASRGGFDGSELREIAGRIKAKLEEFNVRGSVVQINPGPVVTTFEFRPDAGIKVSKIITLNEDLCLGLQAESILIERLAGKSTVGIEVPNSRRELICLREILESDAFREASSALTICLGKDINGNIKVASLETMPHLLIAGSTGSGKSVMLNSLIMSVLFKSTPDEVRMVLVDPKRVEMGIYEGIPHLLTPVITDAKQATNALRNAVMEMERRLKLFHSHRVRNIEQFNQMVREGLSRPRSLFEEAGEEEPLAPLPYVLIVIDELADLMILERANVEASVTRLAQMARAAGMHLVLATQRPSVDVITGIIKANFPSRISFRVATRVDSRTVLDVMGAEHLLGKGDMLFLPPGSSRLVRVHGGFVTENEINRVVEHWKAQADPDYDQSYLLPPPSEEDGEAVEEGERDPMYADAVRVVLEMGKASTSILQRRLRLGYGRAARILDVMHREGIIGPPDGSRPREVLKAPDWLDEE